MEYKNVAFDKLGSESSLRNDIKYLKYILDEQGDTYISDLFEVVSLPSIKVDELGPFKYCQIGDVSGDGDIFPVDIDLENQDMSLIDYYKKIQKGDICKPQKGDILISKVRPYLKKFVFIDDSKKDIYFTSAFICLRPKIKPLFTYYVVRNYLFSFLNSASRQGKGYPTLTPDDIRMLKIKKDFINKFRSFTADDIIEEKHDSIKQIQSKTKNKLLIINDVFSSKFSFDSNDYLRILKGLTFGTQNANKAKICVNKVSFNDLMVNYNLRVSYRSQNPVICEIDKKIKESKFLQVKDILSEPVHRGSTPDYTEDGTIPVIKTAHLKSDEINKEFSQFVSSKTTRSEVKKGDILLASTGKPSIGKIDIINDDNEYVSDSHLSIIRIDETKYNKQFFVYLFRSVYGYAQIERDVVGCTNQVELYPFDIENFLIPDISLDEQKSIVDSINTEFDEQNKVLSRIQTIRTEIDKVIFDYFNN